MVWAFVILQGVGTWQGDLLGLLRAPSPKAHLCPSHSCLWLPGRGDLPCTPCCNACWDS